MFWLIRFAFKLMIRFGLIVAAGAAGFATGLLLQARTDQRTWAVVPEDVERELAGDDLIPVPDTIDTRSLRIDAAPDDVWPWLVQMGLGRGGWYSYDRLDMDQPSADSILPEFQELAEGDVVPTYPGGGFVAKVVQPGQALVLYLDTELIQAQEQAAKEAQAAGEPSESTPMGLEAVGMAGEMTMPEFQGSWSFVLEPAPGGGTWLIERMRMRTAEDGPVQQLGLPFMGLGVFLMTRKHMLGVKERA